MFQKKYFKLKNLLKLKKYVFLILIISFNLFGQNHTDDFQKSRLVNKEKEKLNNFKQGLESITGDEYLNKIRNYSKDSLKTLAIKLLSVKELKEKELLKKDIFLNSDYYIRLLDKLKSSEINKVEYFFLEKELDSYSIIRLKKSRTISVVINVIFIIIILILSFFIYQIKYRKKEVYVEELSKQEKKVTKLITSGKSNKEIAEELFISLNTVKTHITNIYGKLNVSNRKELTTKIKNSTGTST